MNRFTIFLFLFISYTNAYALKPVSPLQKVLTGNLTNNESYALKEIKIISDITKDPKTYDEIIRNIYGQLNNVGNHLMSRFGVFLQVKNEKCGVYLYVRNWLNDNEDSINYSLPIEACEEIALRYSAFEKEFPDESEEQSKVKYLFSTSNSPDFFVKKPQLAQETVEQIVVTIFGELLKKLQEEKPDLVEVTKKEYVILSWMNKTFYVFAGEKEILFKKRNLYQTERQENFIKLKSLVDTLDFNTNAKTEELKGTLALSPVRFKMLSCILAKRFFTIS